MENMSTINNIEITWKPFVTRGLRKEMKTMLLGKISVNELDKNRLNIDLSKEEETKDVFILGMIDKATIDGKTFTPSGKWLDGLPEATWKKIYDEANKAALPGKEEDLKA
jgi:hypothetical protein